MAEVTEVEVGYRVGGKVQVKKFDIQSDYEYAASKRAALEEGDDPDEVVQELLDGIKDLIDPPAQKDFDDLWDVRVGTGS
jgi:hypothetical protein